MSLRCYWAYPLLNLKPHSTLVVARQVHPQKSTSILVGEEVDDFFRSGFFESCEEDDDKYTDGNHDGGDNEVTDSPNIIIFIVEGLDNRINWELYGQLDVPRSKMIHIPLVAEQGINDADPYNGMVNQAKSLLNILLSHVESDSSDTSPIAIGFWASDLAASIVKKALVIASEDPHYSFILDQTSLLVFFGALPGVSAIRSWEAVLLQWTHAYCEERVMTSFMDLVGPLAAFHKQLSLEFDTIMRCHSMRIVNYYEMGSGLKSDDKCLSRFNATFGGLGQARIATPDITSAVRLDQDQIRFLERRIQDEIDRLKSDYLRGLELLALHSPIFHMRPGHYMRFDHLAKYILKKPDFKKWLQDATISPLTRSAWAKSNSSHVVPSNVILGVCVKSLLIGAHTMSVLIIIEQPEDPRVAAPFVDLIYLMKHFIETTETTTRVVILSRAAHQRVTIDDPTIAAPVDWDFGDIGIPTMKIDIDPTSPEVRDALINDYTDIIADPSLYDDQSHIVKADAELIALNNLTKLEAYRAAVALAQKPSFSIFKPREYSPDFDNISQNVVSKILNLLPKSLEKAIWTGLHWLITAHRPLTCQEFAVALKLDMSDSETAIINQNQATSYPGTVFWFVSLFYGLVQVNENRKDTAKHVTPDAAKTHDTEEQEQTAQETQHQIPTLLPYAIEHWFEFLQSDYFNGKQKVMLVRIEMAVERFLYNETLLDRCLHIHKSKGNSASSPWNISIPSLSNIQKRLDLSISDAMALALAPISRHSPLALDNGWQHVALGVIESNNEVALLKADQCKMFDDENILKAAFETASDKSSCVLAISHPDFVQKHSAKLLSHAIRLGNSSFITHLVSQGDMLREDYDVPEAGATILSSMAEFVAPIPHPILWQKYLRYMRHIGEAHKQDKRSPLHLAAASGHRLFIEQAITWMKDHDFGATPLFLATAGAKLAICDKQKQSPLHIACKMGNSKIVAKLDRLEKTPLHLALENRHTAAAANLLLDCTLTTLRYQRPGSHGQNRQHFGSDAITCSVSAETPSEKLMSHFVTSSPDTSIVASLFMTTRFLVSKFSVSVSVTESHHNINVNLKDADGATPLIIATKNNLVDIVKTLLRYDVDVCAKDQPHGQEAIQYAAKYGHTEILKLLLAAMPRQKDIDNDWQISSPSIQCLINYGFDANITDNLGQTALSNAVKSYQANAVASVARQSTSANRNLGFWEASKLNLFHIVEVLIHSRADIDSLDDSGSSALHYCSSNNYPKLMQLLISKGCDLNIVDRAHLTPVFVAILIDAGANVNIHDARGFTPLSVAASGNHDRAVKMLLLANCALSLAYRYTETDLLEKHIAGKFAAAKKLRLQPHKLLWYLQDDHYDIEKVRILLDNSMDPNLIIGEYGSMLHYAALQGRLELVELLCKYDRVNINMIHPNKTHGTPLQIAAFRGNDNGPKIIEILLARDANIYKGSGFYGSALNVAAAMPCSNYYKEKTKAEAAYINIAKLLISHEKTIINFAAGYHGTPILFAIATGSYAMFEFLLTQGPMLSRPTGACGTTLRALLSNEKFDLLPVIELDSEEVSPPRTSATPRSNNGDTYHCAACYVVIYGPVHICQQCIDFKLCFKCYRRVALLHDNNHAFKKVV
ncbi:ankyrin repeat-containing domain protein [Trichoderma sp. SZMC 28013]